MSTASDLSTAAWRKSSYTDGTSGNCVEIADTVPGTIRVRDSKNPQVPALIFPTAAWASLIRTLKRVADA
ncbi:DUF397 domain-containing protein [Streptomyces sp. NPDC026206]|uniref:DUF397 domain-containing protein n=1 Tax=Streptomyces sp. NPDC026206 TaxID=3157089 RepID=UPI003403F56F